MENRNYNFILDLNECHKNWLISKMGRLTKRVHICTFISCTLEKVKKKKKKKMKKMM